MEFIEWVKQSWAYVAAIAAILVTILGLKKSVQEIKSDISRPFCEINKRFDTMEAKIDAKHRNDETVIETLLSMQRADILAACERYIKQGFASLHQKEVLMYQFEAYEKLGGNSFVHDLVNQVQDLPIEKVKKQKVNNTQA